MDCQSRCPLKRFRPKNEITIKLGKTTNFALKRICGGRGKKVVTTISEKAEKRRVAVEEKEEKRGKRRKKSETQERESFQQLGNRPRLETR